jgi:L-asparaginase
MKIAFIQTGGTIDKDYPKSEKGWAFEIDEPAYLRILKKLNPSFEYSSVLGLKKDSTEITQSDRQKLFDLCKSIGYHRIIITHGTDTLLETATFLQKISGKVIVLTGAMRPERFTNSDASINLGIAIGAVQVLTEGVYIAMHGLVLPWQEVSRDEDTRKFIRVVTS